MTVITKEGGTIVRLLLRLPWRRNRGTMSKSKCAEHVAIPVFESGEPCGQAELVGWACQNCQAPVEREGWLWGEGLGMA